MRPIARRASCLAAVALCVTGCRSTKPFHAEPTRPPEVDEQLEELVGVAFVGGNELTPIENGAVFDAMVREIAAADRHVHVLTYIWREEKGPSRRITDALLRRARGVECRILVDPVGSAKFDDRQQRELEASGCEIRSYGLRKDVRPTARNHRKIVIVDGVSGITGGWGIHTAWEGNASSKKEWRDSSVRARGPVVAQMQRAFEQSWREAGGDPLPRHAYPELAPRGRTRAAFVASSPRRRDPSAAEKMTKIVVAAATKRLWIANSYFVPDESLQELLVASAKRGVDVRVLAPGPEHDLPPVRAGQRATYEKLLEAGIRIFEYQQSMMHSKTITIDGRIAVVGSTNMDPMSFERLEEGSIVADSPELAAHLERTFRADVAKSKEITREAWAKRDKLKDVVRETTAAFFSEWM